MKASVLLEMKKQPQTRIVGTVVRWSARATFLSIAIGLFVWHYSLANIKLELKKRKNEVVERLNTKKALFEESEDLNSKIERLQRDERIKLAKLERALQNTRKLEDFPVRAGEHIVLSDAKTNDGIELFFYVPEGHHKLQILLRQMDLVKKSPNTTSHQPSGRPIKKEFRLAPHSAGKLEFRLNREGETCVASWELFDSNGIRIEKDNVNYQKRIMTNTRERSLTSIALPGQCGIGLIKRVVSSKQFFELASIENGTRVLATTFSIESPNTPIFIRPQDVSVWGLTHYFHRKNVSFENLIESVDESGKIFPKPRFVRDDLFDQRF